MIHLKNQLKTIYVPGSVYKKSGTERKNTVWQDDYNQYGKESFEFYLIEDNVPDELHFQREKYWINEYKSYDERFGYNTYCKSPERLNYLVAKPPKPFEE